MHPCQAIRRLFQWENFPRILFHAAVTLPQPERFIRCLNLGSEVRRLVFAEEFFDALELRAVATWDRDFNRDRAALI